MRVALLLLVVACGDNLPAPVTGENVSGQRLKLHWYEYAGGTRQLASTTSMFDAGRGEDCSLLRWSDGLTYCTPSSVIASYTDPECTHEVGRLLADPQGAVPRYIQHVFFLGEEALPSRLYEMGSPIGDVARLYELHGTSCVPAPFDPDGVFVELGAEVPRSELVGVVRRVLQPQGPIAIEVDEGEDGMVVQVGGVAGFLGECTVVERPGEAETTCVPTTNQLTSDFLDPDCTEPALALALGSPLPDLVRVSAPPGEVDLRPLGELTTHRSVYGRQGANCREQPVGDTTQVFGLGERIELPRLERIRGAGGRIHPVTDGGTTLLDPLFYDSELDLDCRSSQLFQDASVRCIPTIVQLDTRFGDVACTDLVNVALVPIGTHPALARSASMARMPVFPVLGPSPTLYEVTTGDRCAQALTIEGFEFHAVGDAIAVGTFAAATLVTE